MNERILSVRWSNHAAERLQERLNAVPADVTDLLIGRTPFLLAGRTSSHGYAVDVRDVCRFILNRDSDPKRSGCWVVVTVLDWDQRHGRHKPSRAKTGREELGRMRTDLTDEEHEWTGRL